jgi:CO/xanthine dehydrogenase FAD-binding subunit
MRLARPGAIVDLNRVAELDYIREENGHVAVGAMTRQRTAEGSDLLARKCPLVGEALRHVGHVPIRTRGTVGGSVAHADPAAELPAVVSALGATVTSVGPAGERSYSSDEFFLGFLTNGLGPGELVKEIRFPVLPARSGACFLEVARRKGDFALVGVATTVTLGEDGTCSAALLALTGVAGVPVRLREVEQRLVGGRLEDSEVTAGAAEAGASLDPPSDIHATKQFRLHLARVLTERALKSARDRALGDNR